MGIAKFVKEKDLVVSVSKVLDRTLELVTMERDYAVLPLLNVMDGDVDRVASGYYSFYNEALQDGLMSYPSERVKMPVTYTGFSALSDKVECVNGDVSFFLDGLDVHSTADRRMSHRCFSAIKGVGAYDNYIFGMLDRTQAIEVLGEDICRYAGCTAVRYYTMVFVMGVSCFKEVTLFKLSDTREMLLSMAFNVKDGSESND